MGKLLFAVLSGILFLFVGYIVTDFRNYRFAYYLGVSLPVILISLLTYRSLTNKEIIRNWKKVMVIKDTNKAVIVAIALAVSIPPLIPLIFGSPDWFKIPQNGAFLFGLLGSLFIMSGIYNFLMNQQKGK